MSKSQTGKIKSEETIKKYSKTRTGMKTTPCSEERRANISRAKKGKPNGLLGSKRSKETCQRISEGQAARNYTHSDEIKLHLSELKKGKPWTEARRLAFENKRKIT